MLACLAVLESFSKSDTMALWDCLHRMKLQIQGSSDLCSYKLLPSVHLLFVLATAENVSALTSHPPMKIVPHRAISQRFPPQKHLQTKQTLPP